MVDMSRCYLHWPNTERVVIVLRRARGDVQHKANYARRLALTRPVDVYQGVRIIGNETIWRIAAAELPGQELRPDDQIQSDKEQVKWKVLSVQLIFFQSAWRAICRRLETTPY